MSERLTPRDGEAAISNSGKGLLAPMRMCCSARWCLLLLGAMLCAPELRSQDSLSFSPDAGAEFFVISSLEAKEGQIVVKRPTEVTEVIQTTEKTVYLDEAGGRLELKALRAGDTVWIISRRNEAGVRVALKIRKGPMTLEQLHRRYLSRTVTSPR